VVAYFLTPDLEVIHAVAGNVKADVFLREAAWAVELWKKLAKLDTEERSKAASEAHAKRLEESPCRPTLRGGNRRASLETVEVVTSELIELTEADVRSCVTTCELRTEVVRDEDVQRRCCRVRLVSNANGAAVDQKLAKEGLPLLKEVYRHFFEEVLGERVSDEDVKVINGEDLRRYIHIDLKERRSSEK
jgi:hypothetical protein